MRLTSPRNAVDGAKWISWPVLSVDLSQIRSYMGHGVCSRLPLHTTSTAVAVHGSNLCDHTSTWGQVDLQSSPLLSLALPDQSLHSMSPRRTAVYTGSFDPITLGHLHIIRRAARLFDDLVVGIGINAEKRHLFDPAERVKLVRRVTGQMANVRVETFDGLAVDFVHELGASVMVRGIRPLTDIAGEFTMMMANHQLDPAIETVFLMADERFAHVSSSLLKQIASLSDDDERLAKFVPQEIISPLRQRLRQLSVTDI